MRSFARARAPARKMMDARRRDHGVNRIFPLSNLPNAFQRAKVAKVERQERHADFRPAQDDLPEKGGRAMS